MNIFKSLSKGNGRISETNITSFLSYLLDSSNELNNSFLLLFFLLVDDNLQENKILNLLNLRQTTLRDKVLEFNKRYTVIAEVEYAINNRKQIVDILLTVANKNEDDIAYLLIENKIKKEANNPEQAVKQYNFFKQSEDYTPGLPIYSILLTADSDRFFGMHKNALAANDHSVWLKWTNAKEANNSIEAILRKLIKNEHEAEIQPIDPNTQFIVKSFIDYMLSEYSQKEGGQRNQSFNGFAVVSAANYVIDGRIYFLRRFENNMVRIFDVNDSLLELDVKPVLRKLNELYHLGVTLDFPGGRKKNTQHLGRDIINALNAQAMNHQIEQHELDAENNGNFRDSE
ncbi:MAG TPA: hypothetical protein VGM30_19785 [Puia sp.]|jgi:hypothetical protein